VIEAFLVVLLGAGLMALGTVESTMYDIAVVVILVGLIGILIRAVEWAKWYWLRMHPQLGADSSDH
jgi:hypothetical protein